MSDEKGWHGRTCALKRLQICELPRNRVSRRHSLVSVYFSAQTGSATLRTSDMRRNRQARVTLVPPTSKNAHVCAHPALFGLNLAFRGGGVFLRDGFLFFCTSFFCVRTPYISTLTLSPPQEVPAANSMVTDHPRRGSCRQRCLSPPVRLTFPFLIFGFRCLRSPIHHRGGAVKQPAGHRGFAKS